MSVDAPAPRRAWVQQVMGMPVSVTVRGALARTQQTQECVDAAFDLLHEADAVFSTYRDDSAVSRINRGELAASAAGPLVAEVLALCAEAWRDTEGWFDPYRRSAAGTVLDPSGLVKSWAVERAAGPLRALAGHDVCVNAGGDVLAWSTTRPWRVGITDPDDDGRLLTVVELTDGGVATSGTAARGTHVWDPYSGRPATSLRQVTVTGPSLMRVDVAATAALARGEQAAAWLERLEGYSYLVVPARPISAASRCAGAVAV